MRGRFQTTAAGHRSYEIFEAEADYLLEMAAVLQNEFGFNCQPPAFGLDEVYIDCWRNHHPQRAAQRLVLGWDNWSGCFVMALSPETDPTILEIGAFFDARFDAA